MVALDAVRKIYLHRQRRPGVVWSSCQHISCMTCLVKWMNGEERSGRTTGPTCPFCRIVICNEDVVRVLGRPFQPREAISHKGAPTYDEVDEFTLVPCAMCGYRIEKIIGCDKVECLCIDSATGAAPPVGYAIAIPVSVF